MIHSNVPGLFIIPAGTEVTFKNIDFTSGLGGTPAAGFENYGTLTLRDIQLTKNPFLPGNEYLIFNGAGGELIFMDDCDLRQ